MGGIKKQNDFKDKVKVGIITAVNPQKKTVDIAYVSQGGNYQNINLPYNIVGLTWGFVFMPVIGDKVKLDNADGDRPTITSMHPNNVDYLPYLDPGEIAMVCENGSYVFARNKRKKIISTGALIDYDATQGPNGETDIEYEPGGLILRARSKKNRDGVQPRWDNHSYLGLFDNGDVTLQSMYMGLTKALLFMDGCSGFTFWSSGNSKVSEYIELNPVTKEIVVFSDGELHTHVQTNSKETIYSNAIQTLGGGLQINLGVDISTIPADYDQILPTNISQGDFYLDNSTTLGSGKITFHAKNDFNILDDAGNFNLTTTAGNVVINSAGNITMNSATGYALHRSLDNSPNNSKTLSGPVGSIVHNALTDISHVAPSLGLGQLASTLTSDEAIINKTHLSNFGSIIDNQRLADMIKLTTTLQPFLNGGAAALAAVQALVLSHISIPNGSAIVKAVT